MATSDRAVAKFDGRTRQVGTPEELCRDPANLDVSHFLSQPYLNVVPAAVSRAQIGEAAARDIRIAGTALRDPTGCGVLPAGSGAAAGRTARIAEQDAILFPRLPDGMDCEVRISSVEIDHRQGGGAGCCTSASKRRRRSATVA